MKHMTPVDAIEGAILLAAMGFAGMVCALGLFL